MSEPEPTGATDEKPDVQVAYRRPLTLLPLLTVILFICVIIVAIVR